MPQVTTQTCAAVRTRIHLPLVTVIALATAVALLAGCGAGRDVTPVTWEGETAVGLPAIGSEAMTFRGVLPCADCEGILHTLNLYPAGVYFLSTEYLGTEGEPFGDAGRWSTDGGRITLEGIGGETKYFSMVPDGGIRMLDRDGNAITSDLSYALARADSFQYFEPMLRVRGMYQYMADAAIFIECEMGWPMRVAEAGDNAALQRGYLNALPEDPGMPPVSLLVEVEGRIGMRPPMEGPGKVLTLVPDLFVDVFPDGTCEAPVSE